MTDEAAATADQELLRELRDMWSTADPPPPGLLAKVLAALAVEDLDAEFELLSLLEVRRDLAGARTADTRPDVATFQFNNGDVELLLHVSVLDSSRRRLDGWLAPAGAMLATLRSDTGEWRAPIDEGGRFEFASLPTGPVRLWLQGGGHAFSTTMFEI